MSSRLSISIAALLAVSGGLGAGVGMVAAAEAGPAKVSFNEHIQPILSENCYQCHGTDAKGRKGDLRLDAAEYAFAPREDGPVILKGDPDRSPLIRRIESKDEKYVMPPPEAHKSVKPAEIALLRQWIREGAPYEKHWAFLKPERPPTPLPQREGWARNAIDAFVLEKLEREGLTPAPEADPYALIRRVSYDLTGLAPTPAEIEAFVSDASPAAYERLVDRLLASPRYGEHRAHYWLDAARHADTTGTHRDPLRQTWPYRDYVIRSYNANQPFDRFAREQLAGDLYPADNFDQIVATGFNRAHITTSAVGEVTEDLQMHNVTDRANTVSTVFLGLTAGCAACHDHKFDPVTQKDYYALGAFFNNSLDPPADNEDPTHFPTISLPPAERAERARAVLKQRADIERQLAERTAHVDTLIRNWIATGDAARLQPVSTDKLQVRFRFDEGKGRIVRNRAPGANPAEYTLEKDLPWWTYEAVKHWPPMRLATTTRLPENRLGDYEATDAFTVAGWFKPRTGRPSRQGSLISRYSLAGKGRGWDLYWDYADPKGTNPNQRWAQGRLIVNLVADGADNAITVRAPRVFGRVEWVHLAATYDGSGKAAGLRLYVNGELQDLEIIKDNLNGSIRTDAPLQLARRTDGPTDKEADRNPMLETAFQDIRLYGRILAGEEIRGTMERDVVTELVARTESKWNADDRRVVQNYFLRHVDPAAEALFVEKARFDQELERLGEGGVETNIFRERDVMASGYILDRGIYNQRKDRVWASVPAFLPPLPAGASADRLGLAQWLFSAENPLTARVTVNRMWQELFGTGIVATLGDFGVIGQRPTHPRLLDWLAVDFRESGWDVKRFYKQIVMSATYRQSARVTPELRERDPDNRLFARGPRFRLDAEMIRDTALAAGGLLVEKPGGPAVHMYEPPGIWEAMSMTGSNTRTHRQSSGDGLYRRSVYTFVKRFSAPPILATFDASKRDVCVVQRERTNTPLQALLTLNAPHFLEASRHLAQRAMHLADTNPGQKVDFMAQSLLTAPLRAPQRNLLVRSYESFRESFTEERAREYVTVGDSPVDPTLPVRELAAWTVVANQLLNTDQALNK
jgi:mono/diheme cytochrome c family protein